LSEQKYLQARYQILSALSLDVARGFNELQKRAQVSTRTLDKHLKRLTPETVKKVNGKYRITNEGIRERGNIQRQLGQFASRRIRLAEEVIRVTFVEPDRSWGGRLIIYSSKKLGLHDHSMLDKALATAMRTIRSEIPRSYEGGRVYMYWRVRKPRRA
jgi:hypothetical protein